MAKGIINPDLLQCSAERLLPFSRADSTRSRLSLVVMATTYHSPELPRLNLPSDQHCSNPCDPTSKLAHLYPPNRLFDPHSTPIIYLGSIAIPGPLLPLSISMVFIFHKLLRFRARYHRDVEIDIARLPSTPRQNSLLWPDLRHPDALRTYTARAILSFHGVITNGSIMHFGQSSLENDTLCCVQVLALFLYAEVVKPEVRKSSLAAAVGWTLFMFLDQLPGTFAIVAAWLVVVLAAPLAWQIDGTRGDVDYQQSVSGLLLMLTAANRVVFDSQVATQQWAKDFPVDAWKSLATLYIVHGSTIYMFNRNRDGRDQDTRWSLQEMLTAVKGGISTVFRFSFLVAAFFGTLVGGVLCTAYLSSCLPWSRFLSGECASLPSLSLISMTFGSVVYSAIFTILHLIQRRRDLRPTNRTPSAVFGRQLEISANVLGWACLLLNTLYLALEVLS
jgi:hypothetical protein